MVSLPAIITTDLRLNEPRYVTLPNIMKAKKKPLKSSPDALGVNVASRIKTLKVAELAGERRGHQGGGWATLVANCWKNEAKVI